MITLAPNYNGNTVDDDCLVADFKRRLIIGGKSARSNEGFICGTAINVAAMILAITWNRTFKMYIDFNLKVDRGSYCEYVNRNFQIQTSVFQKKKKNRKLLTPLTSH